MPLGEGMDKNQWEDSMCKFFHRLLKGSPLSIDPRTVGMKIRYVDDAESEVTTKAEWEVVAVNQEFDKMKQEFLNVGPPPTDPAERRRWETERRNRRQQWEQRLRSKTGKKCPECSGWNTIRITPEDAAKSGKVTAIPDRDYLVCVDCSTRVMFEEQELEVAHDTEIIFLADCISANFLYQGKQVRLRHPEVYVVKVPGRHENWKQEEVRQMMQVMFLEEIVPTWQIEAQEAFQRKMKDLQE